MKNNTPYTYDEVARALTATFKKKRGWAGPDQVMVYGLQRPSWHLSEEGMDYHRERGRGLVEVLFLVAFQLGYNSGHVSRNEEIDMHKDRAKSYQALYNILSEAFPQPEVSETAKQEISTIWAEVMKSAKV